MFYLLFYYNFDKAARKYIKKKIGNSKNIKCFIKLTYCLSSMQSVSNNKCEMKNLKISFLLISYLSLYRIQIGTEVAY